MKELSNEQLVEMIQNLRGDEKRVVAELIRYLHELSQDEMALIEQAGKILSASKVKDTLLGATKKLVVNNQKLTEKREKRVKSLPTSDVVFQSEQVISVPKPSRYIPADVRYSVEQKDGCRCSFVSAEGKRCSETRRLQVDHIVPFSLGGKPTVENLRLLCQSHNLMEAENVFGEAAIRGLVQYKQKARLAQKSV